MLFKRKKLSTIMSHFLVILLALSLFNPMFVSADSENEITKKEDVTTENIEKIKEVVDHQESQLERRGELNPKLKNMKKSADEEVSVIVQLSEAPVALEKGKNKLKGQLFSAAQESTIKNQITLQQKSLVQQMDEQNIQYKQGYTYNHTLNGMELKVSASDLEKLANLSGVVSVDPNEVMYALEDNSNEIGTQMIDSNPHLGIPEIWDDGIEGEGIEVGVIDTGIDYDHPDLEGVYKGGMNFVDHDGDEYARDREEDDPYETSPEDRPEGMPEFDELGNSFYTSHGTHVAGTIAAAGENEYGVKGIAPKADIYAYRVLGAYGSGLTSGVIAGIEQSVEDEMDVINLSLGGGSNSEDDLTAFAVNNATLDGITVVSATGNAGPGLGSIGTPATSPLGIAVGNSTLPETTHSAEVHVEAGDYSHDSDITMMAWTFGTLPEEALDGEFDIVAVPGWGAPGDYEDLDVDGKVALISRGESPFVDKIDAAKDAGAIATIIHNNEGEGPADVYLGDSFEWIPSFDMSTEEGEALREALEADPGTVSFSHFEEDQTAGDEINDSSSRGPSTPNFDIKPDVVAPGTNIMSTMPVYQQDYPDASFAEAYDRKTGTSMAAPHVAGIAALLLSANGDWDPFDVKVAMSNTAKKFDTESYNVFEQGAGLVQPVEALSAGVEAYVPVSWDETDGEGNETGEEFTTRKGTVTFGRFAPDEEDELTVTREIKVRSLNGESGEFTVDIEEDVTGSGATIEVDRSSFTLDSGGEETIEVTLTVEPGEDIPGNEFLGYINITGDATSLSLPYAVELSAEVPTGLEYYYLDDEAISPNGDGKLDETNLNFSLYDDQPNVIFELWSPIDPGPEEDGYIGYLDAGAVPAGAYYLPIDGTYFDWETGEETDVPDGVYTIDFNTLNMEDGAMETLDYAPIFIKRDAPQVLFDEIDDEIGDYQYELTGSIDDQFIDFKEIVEESFEEDYDVNDYLTISYELFDDDMEVVDEDPITLEQDGEFAFELDYLLPGDYSLVLSVEDVAANTAEETVHLKVDYEPEDVHINASPSTTDETTGPVTITVDAESEVELASVKWLAGDKDAGDFADDGHEIDSEEMSFEVEDNGVYTVYAKNKLNIEAVETVSIDNIVGPEISVSLTSSPEEETAGPVTISVDAESESELDSIKWLAGDKDAEDFADDGHEVDLEEMSFDVEDNGVYTVYAKNKVAGEAVETISVDNIVEPEPEPEEFDVTLTPSTEDKTKGPVTITVDTNSEADLELVKWLAGERTAEDFDDDGHEVDLEEMSFDVDENDVYTVYARNSEDVEAVGTITIDNIVDPADPKDPTDPKGPKKSEGRDDDGESGVGAADDSNGHGKKMPKTATPWFNYLLYGGILVALGLATFIISWKRRVQWLK